MGIAKLRQSISHYISLAKSTIQKAVSSGFIYVVGSQFLNKILQFSSSIILVRVLSISEYGRYTYSANLLNIFLLIQGLGAATGILQFVSSAKDSRERALFFSFGLKIACAANAILIVVIFVVQIIANLPLEGTNEILGLLAFVPIFYGVFESFQSFFRATQQNRIFSINSVISSAVFLLSVYLGGRVWGIRGVVVARYLSIALPALYAVYLFRSKRTPQISSHVLSKSKKKEFIRFSLISTSTAAMSHILYLVDVFLVGLILRDDVIVATYKSASLIPFALGFLPVSIMIFAYPRLAKNADDTARISSYFNLIILVLGVANMLMSLFLVVFAKQIISLVFGADYIGGVRVFRILSIGYFISGTFRIPSSNILASIRKVEINLINATLSGILNISLDIALINRLGETGAAITNVIVFAFSGAFSTIYLIHHLRKSPRELKKQDT